MLLQHIGIKEKLAELMFEHLVAEKKKRLRYKLNIGKNNSTNELTCVSITADSHTKPVRIPHKR